MSGKTSLKTWIEIDRDAIRQNYRVFKKLIGPKIKLWSVVKSNAYGHGLLAFSRVAEKLGVYGFCVDSVREGLALRKDGIKKPILVIGPSLPHEFQEAAENKITISVATHDDLKTLSGLKKAPAFHIKIDTGMNRRGFRVEEIQKVVSQLSLVNGKPSGLYTHFASAKDVNYQTYTEMQFKNLKQAAGLFRRAGFKDVMVHASATGGVLVSPKYHLDAVRVGAGLYGLWPSKELEMQCGGQIELHPALSWHTVVSEVKQAQKGDYIGYDLAERMSRPTTFAVLPVGYWHGLPRSLSHQGEVLIGGKRARILGRVSMDLTAVDVTGMNVRLGDRVTIIGKQKKEEITAQEIAGKAGTIHYEFLTRLNPLMERRIV